MVNSVLFAGVKYLKFYSCRQKNVQSDRIYVSVGIVGLSRVRARQCTSTPSLQDVEFLDHMFPCCLVLAREAFFISESD